MKYEERVSTVKTYDVTVDIDDFIDWLDGDTPTYESLKDYLEEGNADYDFVYEHDEGVLDSEVYNYDKFLKEVKDAIESRD